MGVAICYWSDNNFPFSTLNELVYKIERLLNAKTCLVHQTNHCKNETYWKFNIKKLEQLSIFELGSVFDSFTLKLIVEDHENLITDLSQNIINLVITNKIEIRLSFINYDDLDVTIKEKTINWKSWYISFARKFFTFAEEISDPNAGFTNYDFKTLYLMDRILKVFNSTRLLLIGDSYSELWSDIEDQLDEGESIDNILENIEDCNIITSEMILSKKVAKLTEYDIEKTVFLFSFKDFGQYYIPCTFEERFNKEVEIQEVKIKENVPAILEEEHKHCIKIGDYKLFGVPLKKD